VLLNRQLRADAAQAAAASACAWVQLRGAQPRASALFLVGVALVYALTGTLNLADMALRVPLVQGPDAGAAARGGAAAAGGVRLQGGPLGGHRLSIWLPASYAAASAPVAALSRS